jgi:hypothetical protein
MVHAVGAGSGWQKPEFITWLSAKRSSDTQLDSTNFAIIHGKVRLPEYPCLVPLMKSVELFQRSVKQIRSRLSTN